MHTIHSAPIFTRAKVLLCAVAALTITPALWSASWFNIDFEGALNVPDETPHTQSPATAAPHVNTSPTSVNSNASVGNTVLIAEDFTAGSATLSGKSAVLTYDRANGNINSQLFLTNNTDDYAAGQPFRIDFDFLFNSASMGTGNTLLGVRLRNNESSAIIMNIVFVKGGGLNIGSVNSGTTLSFTDAWSADSVSSFTGILNPENRQFRAYIDGNLIGSVVVGEAYTGDAFGINSVVFQNASTSTGVAFTVGLDNIVTQIPEPGQVTVLVGALALALVVCRRYIQRKEK